MKKKSHLYRVILIFYIQDIAIIKVCKKYYRILNCWVNNRIAGSAANIDEN